MHTEKKKSGERPMGRVKGPAKGFYGVKMDIAKTCGRERIRERVNRAVVPIILYSRDPGRGGGQPRTIQRNTFFSAK